VDIVNEKSFDVERFSGQYRRERRGASNLTKNNIS
jgi:hypothetical protein